MRLGVTGKFHRALLVLHIDHADVAEHFAGIVGSLDQSVFLSVECHQLLDEGIAQVLSFLRLPVLEGLWDKAFHRNIRELNVDSTLSAQDDNFASHVHSSEVITRIRFSESLVLGISDNIAELHPWLVGVEDVRESSRKDSLNLLDLVPSLEQISLQNMDNGKSRSHSCLIAPLSRSLLSAHAGLVAIDWARANFLVWGDHMHSHLEPRLIHIRDRLRRGCVKNNRDGSNGFQVLSHLGIVCLLSGGLASFESVNLVNSDVIILAQHDWFAILTACNCSNSDVQVALRQDTLRLLKLVEEFSSNESRANNANRNLLCSH
mmetsp:Transcript_7727/g.17658  ORF Transcript_7727/g.17658 Transcript_7727/m.17658 type:complete len:319 (+) Transcript_7727:223-1179(+)